MPCLLTGLFTVLYTLFVYFNVLLKADQDWNLIITIFCLTWIGVYLVKGLVDFNHDKIRCKLVLGTGITINLAPLAKIQLVDVNLRFANPDTFLFFTATCFCALYFLLIRDSAKELVWDNRTSWKYDFVQCFLAVSHLFFLYASMVDERVKTTDRHTLIFHLITLNVMSALGTFDLWAILMGKLKLKEPVERPIPIEYPMDDEGISTPTRVNYAFGGVFNGKKTVEGKQFDI